MYIARFSLVSLIAYHRSAKKSHSYVGITIRYASLNAYSIQVETFYTYYVYSSYAQAPAFTRCLEPLPSI